MLTVSCQNPACARNFTPDRSEGPVACPVCGSLVSVAPATVDTLPLPETDVKPAPVPPVRERIGRFEVRQQLGEGAFGVVFRAYDPQLEREVALKVAKPQAVATAERRGRFLREAR